MQTLFFVILLCSAVVNADFGIDVSSLTSESSFRCLADSGYTFVVPRAWKSTGAPDTACPQTVKNAWNGGMKWVDVYFFPCISCGNPAQQVIDCTTALANANTTYGRIWFDVERYDLWSSNFATNIEFFQTLLNTTKSLGIDIGIYASKTQWETIFGGWEGGKTYPLWYPRYNNQSNYDDFTPFGGWTTPFMKQFQQNTPYCGAFVDFNWFPPSPSPTPSTSVTPSRTPSNTPTASVTASVTPSTTPSSSVTPTTTPSVTPSITPSPTSSRSPSSTPSITPSVTPTVTPWNKRDEHSPTDAAVVGGAVAASLGGGLVLAGGVIAGYLMHQRRKELILREKQAQIDLASLSSRLAAPDN